MNEEEKSNSPTVKDADSCSPPAKKKKERPGANVEEEPVTDSISSSSSALCLMKTDNECLSETQSLSSAVERKKEPCNDNMKEQEIADSEPSTSAACKKMGKAGNVLNNQEFASSLTQEQPEPLAAPGNVIETEEMRAAITSAISVTEYIWDFLNDVKPYLSSPQGSLNLFSPSNSSSAQSEEEPSTSAACKARLAANNPLNNDEESPTRQDREPLTGNTEEEANEMETQQPSLSISEAFEDVPNLWYFGAPASPIYQVPPSPSYRSNSPSYSRANDNLQSPSPSSVQSDTEYNTDSAPSSPCTPISTSSAGSDNTDGSDIDDPPDSIRFDLRSHWCEWGEKSRCRFCRMQISATRCEKCGVNLCFNMKKNCFTAYHLHPEM